jgi:serine/threonine protein kinase
MEPLCPGAAAAMVSGLDASELVGRRFGPYRAIGLIGEGAMGSVFLAVRADDAFERQVAVKERRILARLDHPGICRLLDAGTTDDGLAYIVMERVEGVSLAEWRRRELDGHDAAASRLQRRRAVQLFARICDAVSCAHREGIVHRDLKPANILVSRTEARNEPNPRVIDFGIARVADSNLTLRVTLETRLLGTLPYMAPEQVAGDRRLIDARADVYALGVILYELLTGRAPLDLEHTALPEAIRIIQNEEPTRLGLLDRSLRGDLETIVAKAMEKVPDRRYASAVEIHADVVRWLSDQTIVARPPSRADRITKFTRRHRVLVAGSSAVFLSLSVAVIAVSISLIRSERQSGRVRAVNEFMHSLLASADPFGPPNRPVVRRPNGADGILASDMLDAAVERLASHPVNDPIVEADIRHSLGVSYSGLGKTEQAISQLRRALALNTAQLGKNAASTLECTIDLATALARSDAFDEAEQLHRGALAQSWELLGPHHSLTLRARLELASCLLHEHRFEDARAETSRVISDAGTADEPVAALASGLRAISLLLSDHAEGDSEARALAAPTITSPRSSSAPSADGPRGAETSQKPSVATEQHAPATLDSWARATIAPPLVSGVSVVCSTGKESSRRPRNPSDVPSRPAETRSRMRFLLWRDMTWRFAYTARGGITRRTQSRTASLRRTAPGSRCGTARLCRYPAAFHAHQGRGASFHASVTVHPRLGFSSPRRTPRGSRRSPGS